MIRRPLHPHELAAQLVAAQRWVAERGPAAIDVNARSFVDLAVRIREYFYAEARLADARDAGVEYRAAEIAAQQTRNDLLEIVGMPVKRPAWQQRVLDQIDALPEPELRRGRLARVWRWLVHGDPW